MYPRILSFGAVAVLAVLAVFMVGGGGTSPIGGAPVGMDAAAFSQHDSSVPLSEPWDAF